MISIVVIIYSQVRSAVVWCTCAHVNENGVVFQSYVDIVE